MMELVLEWARELWGKSVPQHMALHPTLLARSIEA
jgi:hypothetical protein